MRKLLFIGLCFMFHLQVLHADEIEIQGEDVVEIAVQGESIAEYTAPKGFVFHLEKEKDGVSITKKGLLCIKNSAKEGSIVVLAKNTKQTIMKKIRLVKSWPLYIKGAESYQIPDTKDMDRYQIKKLMPTPALMKIVRGGILFILVLLGGGYFLYRKK